MSPERLVLLALASGTCLALGVWTACDVVRHPPQRWEVVGRSKRTWLLLHLLGLAGLPLLPVSLLYLVRVRPALRRVARDEPPVESHRVRPVDPSAPSGTIALRCGSMGTAVGRYPVQVDEDRDVRLRQGEVREVVVAAGEHTVVAGSAWMRSAPLVVDVPAGGVVRVEMTSPGDPMGLEALVDPRSATRLAVVERFSRR